MYKTRYGEYPEFIELHGHKVQLPEPPKKVSEIINWGKPIEKQKWGREQMNPFFDNKNISKLSVNFKNDPWWFQKRKNLPEDIVDYVTDQWEKRRNGVWIMIKERLFWIPGVMWFYLQWYMLPIGQYPDFREKDWRFFIFWDYCCKNPDCFGMIHLKGRREGATAKSACIGLEFATGNKDARVGIQSKKEEDARKLFSDFIQKPFFKLPPFFMSPYDKSNKTDSGLILSPPPIRASRTKNIFEALDQDEEDGAINSIIDFQATTSNAYDSQRLDIWICDEWCKWQNASIGATWNVAKPVLADPIRPGRALMVSTTPAEDNEDSKSKEAIEAMERGKKLFFSSKEIDSITRQTASGLSASFFKGTDSMVYPPNRVFIDEWGFGKDDEARVFLTAQIASQERAGNLAGALGEKRQYPETEHGAFTMVSKRNPFNTVNIEYAMSDLDGVDAMTGGPKWANYVRIGDLSWKNPHNFADGVAFHDNPRGRFAIRIPEKLKAKGFVPGSPDNIGRDGKFLYPKNQLEFVHGCDPFKFNLKDTAGYDLSLGAILGFWMHDPKIDGNIPSEEEKAANPRWTAEYSSHSFLLGYKYRPSTVKEFADDLAKSCVYLGCYVNLEINTGEGVKQELVDMGMARFILEVSKTRNDIQAAVLPGTGKMGSYTTDRTNEIGIKDCQEFYQHHCYAHRIPLIDVLKEASIFDPNNITKFDFHSAMFKVFEAVNVLAPRRRVVANQSENKQIATVSMNWYPS